MAEKEHKNEIEAEIIKIDLLALAQVIKERCEELDIYQQSLLSELDFEYFPLSHEMPYSIFEFEERGYLSDKNQEENIKAKSRVFGQPFNLDNRIVLNENCYKEIFFLLNRIMNNDKRYDEYIKVFRNALLCEFNLFVINSYFELAQKDLEDLVRYSRVENGQVMNAQQLLEKVDKMCDKYGIEYVMAANKALEDRLEGIDKNIARKNLGGKSLEQVIRGDFKVEFDAEYVSYETKMSGPGRTIFEIQTFLNEKARKLGISIEDYVRFIKKLRNVGSHGELEVEPSRIIMKNNQTPIVSPSNNTFFTQNELNDIVINILGKMNNNHSERFSPMIPKLFNILSSSDPTSIIDKQDSEIDKTEMISLLVLLSLFSIIQLNYENLFKYLKNNQLPNFKNNGETIFNISDQNIEGIALEQEGGILKNIKNAIGHNNVHISFFNIICCNDYVTYKSRINANTGETFLHAEDYTDRIYVPITFKVLDWIKYISDDKFFKMISLTALDQEKIINLPKK